VVQLLKKELELAMMLCGRANVAAIDRQTIW